MNGNILVVDDEADMLSTCKAALSRNGMDVVLEQDAPLALEKLRRGGFDLVVTDLKMPRLDGLSLFREAKKIDPELPFILITAFPDVDSAVEALREGALDYLVKPFHPDDLQLRVRRALEQRRLKDENRLLARHVTRDYRGDEITGSSAAMRAVLELVDKVAATPADVLILGESGTGKELIARRLHARSGRQGHFVPVDCGAIPEPLLENEFFGHERGSYTDAAKAAPGLLEFADGGTFFLDEVAELPLSLQAKLLRALQERQFRRVGGRSLQSVDVRVIAATNRDIKREVKEGRFRKDLYYRLNVISVDIPPLRERREDIPPLIEHYLPRYSREMGRNVNSVEEDAVEILSHYSWPGNVRELQNVLKKSVVMCGANIITAEDLPEFLVAGPVPSAEDGGRDHESFSELKKKELQDFERKFFKSLLRDHQGNAKATAQAAGIPLSNLYWYMKKYQLKPQSFR